MAGEIILGYDGSDGARNALAVAIDMSVRLGAELVIFYGYEVSAIGSEVADLAAALRERGQETLDEAAEVASRAGLKPRLVLEEGQPAAVLAALAGESEAAMVIVGTRGESPLRGLILGSLAHKLLHLSAVPVLVVPL